MSNVIENQSPVSKPEVIKQEAPGVYPLRSLAVKKACGCPLFQPCYKCGKYLDKKEFEAGVKAQTEPVASNAGIEAIRDVMADNSRLMKVVMETNERLKQELATMTEQKDMFAKENAVLKRELIDNVNIDADETSSREEYTLRLQTELSKVRKDYDTLKQNNKELHQSQLSAVKHQEDLMRQIRQAMIQNESHRANLESSLDTIHSLKQQINALSKQGRGF
jgi:DNA repair exonuclease SbcCD ATPase subunit